jgi:hypothetical protein
VFQIAQFRGIVTGWSVTCHNVTDCSTQKGQAVNRFLKVFLHRGSKGLPGKGKPGSIHRLILQK